MSVSPIISGFSFSLKRVTPSFAVMVAVGSFVGCVKSVWPEVFWLLQLVAIIKAVTAKNNSFFILNRICGKGIKKAETKGFVQVANHYYSRLFLFAKQPMKQPWGGESLVPAAVSQIRISDEKNCIAARSL